MVTYLLFLSAAIIEIEFQPLAKGRQKLTKKTQSPFVRRAPHIFWGFASVATMILNPIYLLWLSLLFVYGSNPIFSSDLRREVVVWSAIHVTITVMVFYGVRGGKLSPLGASVTVPPILMISAFSFLYFYWMDLGYAGVAAIAVYGVLIFGAAVGIAFYSLSTWISLRLVLHKFRKYDAAEENTAMVFD